jgi:8-oxo-dGTP pyrophosphatase MutT (NUDIX family)
MSRDMGAADEVMDVSSLSDVDHFQTSNGPLVASNAAAGLLLAPDGDYLLQLREQKSSIWYPGHWGLFGGAIDDGESAETALYRELSEELGLVPLTATYFTRFDFDFSFVGHAVSLYRVFYEIPVSAEQLERLVLHEGAAIRGFSPAEILSLDRLAPYDAFAIWLHLSRSRVRTAATASP